MLSVETKLDYLSLNEQKFLYDDVVALHSSGIASIFLFRHDSKVPC